MPRRPIEIERKWLVDKPPDLSKYKGVRIIQGYIAVTPEGTEVRLRRKGAKYYVTIKSGSGLQRGENEIDLSRRQFKSLWAATNGRRLEKVRYTFTWRGKTIELDVYRKELAGLKVVEVEFKTIKQAQAFRPPKWFGREVTDEEKYKNVSLAIRGKE